MSTSSVEYKNRFGAVVLTPVTSFMPVADIRKTHPQAIANTFDLETAEKIALITGNRRVQLCPHYPLDGKAYVVLHDTPSTAAICSVQLKEFCCDRTPADMLNLINNGAQAFA